MEWIYTLVSKPSVAQAVLVLSMVATVGLLFGQVRIRGIGLGIAGVLFSGIVFGHLGLAVNEEILQFVREFGLILFVYTIGIQVGPGFIGALRNQGMVLNGLAAAVVALGVLMTLLLHLVVGIDMSVAVGLYAGATTNTPALAAAGEALRGVSNLPPEKLANPALGYAVAYPFGVIGIILSMLLVKRVFAIDPAVEAERFLEEQRQQAPNVTSRDLLVENPSLEGLRLESVPVLKDPDSGLVVSRLLRGDQMMIARADTEVKLGDILHAVGTEAALKDLRLIVGKEVDKRIVEMPSQLAFREMFVTRSEVNDTTVKELGRRFDVVVSRVGRAGIEIVPSAQFAIQFGDRLRVVGGLEQMQELAQFVGDSRAKLDHPEVMPILVGIGVGVVAGSWPIALAGLPAPVKLGLAGGPLVIALLLSYLGHIGRLHWYMPHSANLVLRELGILLFLASVGLHAGDRFFETLFSGAGLLWMFCAAFVTLVPLLIVSAIGRLRFGLNFLSLCGLLAGSMTDPPALAFAGSIAQSNAPSVAYATVYPLVMLLRLLTAQVMVVCFFGS